MAQQVGRRSNGVSYAEFVKMPPAKYTFRYASEKREHGTITIRIRVHNYVGRAKAVLACVTEEEEGLLPHPNMVMCLKKHKCPDAVCTIEQDITENENEIEFKQIGILRVKKEVLMEAMRIRTSDTDFPYVRGKVLTEDAAGELRYPMDQVVTTHVTHYKESLKIQYASHDRGAATGGLTVLLFTAKLPQKVHVVFRETNSDWQAMAAEVIQHHGVALRFTTPPYQDPYCPKEVKVYYFMMARTVGNNDEQLPDEENRREFTYLPITDENVLEEKKRRKNITPTVMDIIHGGGMQTEDRAGPSAAAAAAAAPETHQHQVGLSRSEEIDGGAIPQDLYQNPAEHYIPESWRFNNPLPQEIVDIVNELTELGMEVDSAARNALDWSLSIDRSLLEQQMEVDIPGFEDLLGLPK